MAAGSAGRQGDPADARRILPSMRWSSQRSPSPRRAATPAQAQRLHRRAAASSCPAARRHRAACPARACVLHRVGRDAQGPLDSAVGRRGGALPLPLPGRHRGDLPAERALRRHRILLAAGPHQSRAARHRDAAASSTTPRAPRRSRSRRATSSCRAPGEDGTRPVLDLIVLRNDGRSARGSRPIRRIPRWSARAPAPAPATCRWARATLSPDAVVRAGRHGQGARADRAGAEAALARVRDHARPATARVPGRIRRRRRSTCWSRSGARA